MAPMWDRIDPLAEKYYGISPYANCGGDPVNRGDYDGLFPDSVEVSQAQQVQQKSNTEDSNSYFDPNTALSHTSIYFGWVAERHRILETPAPMVSVPSAVSKGLAIAPLGVDYYNKKHAKTKQEYEDANLALKWDAIGVTSGEVTGKLVSAEFSPLAGFVVGSAVGLAVSNYGPECEKTYDRSKAYMQEKIKDTKEAYSAAKIITKIGIQIYNRYFK